MTAKEYWVRALRGSQWLVERQNPDGSWKDLAEPKVDAFYKGSWPLLLTGQPAAAHRLLNYTRQQFMTAGGDFVPRGHPWHTGVHYLYANAYFITGGMVAGRYDIAMPATGFLLSQQDAEHGGFYSRRTEAGHRELCDTMSAGAAGMALLAAGQIEAARRVAGFLSRMIELQPDPATRFYTTVEADGRLGTEMQEEGEAWWRIIDTQTGNQCWYAVGLPFAFLIRLAEATGSSQHRDLAQWYFDFQTRCVDPWDGGSSGKAGWGCAMLYRITGETQYRDIALHIADRIAGRQNADGGWVSLRQGYGEGGETALSNADFDVTSEFTLWLALIAANITARDGNQ
jgi:hypothetical protein